MGKVLTGPERSLLYRLLENIARFCTIARREFAASVTNFSLLNFQRAAAVKAAQLACEELEVR